MEVLHTTLFVFLCFHSAESREDRIRALDSQVPVPFTNKQTNSGLDEKLPTLRTVVNNKIAEGVSDQFFSIIERIDKIENTLNSLDGQFYALMKGLSDEKANIKCQIDDIKRDAREFKQLMEDQIEAGLQEKKQIQEDMDDYQSSLRENQNNFEEKIELHLKKEKDGMKSSMKKQLVQFKNRFQDEMQEFKKETLAAQNENFNEFDRKTHRKINDISEKLSTLSHSFSSFEVNFPCPPNWNRHKFLCYLFVNKGLKWSSALRKCRKYGGTLAEVHDSDTLDFINKFINKTRGDFRYGNWIGGTDKETEGIWKWIESGLEIQYFDWNAGQPNSYGDQDCLSIYNGKYGDETCTLKFRYICQKAIPIISD